MTSRLTLWLHRRREKTQEVHLEDIAPLHPDEYPARHLKEILDRRRADFSERQAQPTGMLDGPGPGG
jgi:hypothetical protein